MTKQQQPSSVSISAGSDIVFHQTHLYAALKILNHDQFELSPAAGVVAEQALQTDQNRHDPDSLRKLSKSAIGKSFYLSMARSKVGAFARAAGLNEAGPRARRRRPIEHAALAQLMAAMNRVGNNLNQIARNTNLGIDIDVPVLRYALHEYHAVVGAIYEALGMENAGDHQGKKPGGR